MIKKIFLFFFFILTFSHLNAINLELTTQETKDKIAFSYNFYDFLRNKQSVFFELSKNFIQQSEKEIPSLKYLHQAIHTDLPNNFYKIAEENFKEIEKDYYYHLSDIQEIIRKAKNDLEGFTLDYECPDKIVNYQIEFIKGKNFAYQISLNLLPCSFDLNSNEAYQILLNKIQNSIQQTKKSIPAEITYLIHKNKSGFNVSYEIPVFSKEKQKKILQKIEKNNKKIEDLQNKFNSQQTSFKKYFQEITETNELFLKKMHAKNEKILPKILQEINKIQEQEYQKHYLKVEKTKQGYTISPDYKKLVLKYKPQMEPVSFALYDSYLQQRQMANKILNFLQSIDYNTLQKRDLEYFSGFYTPPTLFYKNEGDCDSKAVAFLSIAKNLFQNTKAIIVLIPGHAFIGIEIDSEKKDETLVYKGINYVLAEVAGPAITPFGVLSSRSKSAIKKKEINEVIVF